MGDKHLIHIIARANNQFKILKKRINILSKHSYKEEFYHNFLKHSVCGHVYLCVHDFVYVCAHVYICTFVHVYYVSVCDVCKYAFVHMYICV